LAGDRITLFADGEETTLADWDDTVAEGADIAPSNDFQIVRFFRGLKIAVFDRANRSVTLSFVVNQEWNDDVEAWDKWNQIRNDVPATGDLTWESRNAFGTRSRYVIGCGVQVKPVRRMGSATWFRYDIIGGEMTTQTPTGGAA
jgi:hypothetical protein